MFIRHWDDVTSVSTPINTYGIYLQCKERNRGVHVRQFKLGIRTTFLLRYVCDGRLEFSMEILKIQLNVESFTFLMHDRSKLFE